MTGTEMIDMLGLRLEDPDQASFTSATKIKAINIAQRTVVNLVDNAYLTELQEIDPATFANNAFANDATGNGLDATGKATFTGLGIDPIRGGVIAINVYDDGGSSATDLGFANMIEPQDAKRLENSYLAGSTTNPVAYIFNETIYIKPVLADGAVDVWYVKNPTAVAANNTECELNVALQESILDFAESQLWKMDNKPDRAGIAYTNATNQIQALNARYQVEKPKGIGTQGRA
jgi:hypothetical protein